MDSRCVGRAAICAMHKGHDHAGTRFAWRHGSGCFAAAKHHQALLVAAATGPGAIREIAREHHEGDKGEEDRYILHGRFLT